MLDTPYVFGTPYVCGSPYGGSCMGAGLRRDRVMRPCQSQLSKISPAKRMHRIQHATNPSILVLALCGLPPGPNPRRPNSCQGPIQGQRSVFEHHTSIHWHYLVSGQRGHWQWAPLATANHPPVPLEQYSREDNDT